MHVRRSRWAVLAILAFSGCWGGNGLTLARVRGTLTYEGEPVKFGYIIFVPDAGKGTDGPIAMSSINPDGSFDLSTEESSDGAIVGFHKVRIDGLDPNPVSEAETPKPDEDARGFMAAKAKTVARRASSPKASRVFKARDGKSYRIVLPEKFENPETSGISVEVGRGSNRINIAVKSDGSASVTP